MNVFEDKARQRLNIMLEVFSASGIEIGGWEGHI